VPPSVCRSPSERRPHHQREAELGRSPPMDQRRSRKGGPTLPSGHAKSEPRVILNTSPYTGQVKRRSPIAGPPARVVRSRRPNCSTRQRTGRSRPGRSPSRRGFAHRLSTTTSGASRRCWTRSSATVSRSSCGAAVPGARTTTRSRTFAQAGTAMSPSGSSFPAPTRTSTATSSRRPLRLGDDA
jgi:hypothetical protein